MIDISSDPAPVAASTADKVAFLDRAAIERRDFWRRALLPLPPRLGLRPDFRSGVSHTKSLDQTLGPDVQTLLKQRTGGSVLLLRAVFLAATACVLSRYESVSALTLGSLDDAAAELFPVRLEIDPAASVKNVLAGLRQTLIESARHGGRGWAALASELELAEEISLPFAVAIAVGPAGRSRALDGLDVILAVETEPQSVQLKLFYDGARFAETSIAQFAHHVLTFVTRALAAPGAPIGAVSLLDDAERERVLFTWNHTASPLPKEASFDALFRRQARLTPTAIALEDEDGEQWSYEALDCASDGLARQFKAAGLERGAIAGLLLPPEPARIAALLAVLKLGAIYLPLDPDYPVERLDFMVRDCDLSLLVTTAELRARIGIYSPSVLLLGPTLPTSDTPLAPVTEADDAAYLIYTSGSTGRPKGAILAHCGLVNLIREQIRLFRVTPASRVLQFASFSFDAALSEIGMALCAGATLVVAGRQAILPGPPLTKFLRDKAITHVTLPPSSLAVLPAGDFPALTTLIVAGEICPAPLVDEWAPGRLFVNGYGPTEATIGVAFAECRPGMARPPIGRIIANMRAYVLDEAGAPVAIGVAGELYLGGIGLARGYLGRPDLTEARFVSDPFCADPGDARLYRTGDLVRWLPDGSLDFLGRVDEQVKLRGHRIESGEIEAALIAHPAIGEAAVVLREDKSGEPSLTAFFVPRSGMTAPASQELRRHLVALLPSFMLPNAFVALEAGLPRTPNLKIDRAALRAQAISKTGLTVAGLGPRDAMELALTRIWGQALGSGSVGVRDNFFELGGHSMLAVRVVAQIEERMGYSLSVNSLMEAPTVEGLAALLRKAPASRPWSPVVSIRGDGEGPPLWLVHPAGGTVLCYVPLASALGPNLPVYGLQEQGIEVGQRLLESIEAMARLYLQAMRSRQRSGPWRLAGWSLGGVIAYEMARILEEDGEEVGFIGLIDSYAPTILPPALRDYDDAQHLVDLFGADLSLSVTALRLLAPKDQLAHVLALAHDSGLIPRDLGLDQAERLLNLYKANQRAVLAYEPPALQSRLSLFRAKSTISGPAGAAAGEDPTLGWAERSVIDLHWIEGSHQTMMRAPLVAGLGNAMRAALG